MTDQKRSDRLRVGIVGAGMVGPVLGLALAGAGHEIVAINAAGDAAKERAQSMLPGVALLEVPEVVQTAELVIFAVPATELPEIIAGLSHTSAWQPGQLVLHTAAEHGFGVFKEALAQGVIPLALHPAMVFTGTSLDLARLKEATIAVTAPTPVLPIGQALAVEMGAEPVIVPEADRAVYADTVEALATLTASLAKQSLETLNGLALTNTRRTVLSIARAALDQATLNRGELNHGFEHGLEHGLD